MVVSWCVGRDSWRSSTGSSDEQSTQDNNNKGNERHAQCGVIRIQKDPAPAAMIAGVCQGASGLDFVVYWSGCVVQRRAVIGSSNRVDSVIGTGRRGLQVIVRGHKTALVRGSRV